MQKLAVRSTDEGGNLQGKNILGHKKDSNLMMSYEHFNLHRDQVLVDYMMMLMHV